MNVGIEFLPFPTGNWLVAGMPRLFGCIITGHRRIALRRDRRKQGALTGLARDETGSTGSRTSGCQSHALHPWPNQRFAVKHPRWEPDAGMPHVRFCAGLRLVSAWNSVAWDGDRGNA